MKVKQLIAILQLEDPEKEVVLGPDIENWYYDVAGVSRQCIEDGRYVEDVAPNCVVVEMFT